MQSRVAVMGEISFSKIGSGITQTIHDDGTITSLADKFCDCCEVDKPALGGFTLKDMSGEAVIWLCSQCRG